MGITVIYMFQQQAIHTAARQLRWCQGILEDSASVPTECDWSSAENQHVITESRQWTDDDWSSQMVIIKQESAAKVPNTFGD